MILPTLDLEKELWAKGYKYIAGIDEVGRGPLAGPVVAGALIITSEEQVVDGVRDSKTLSEKRREELCKRITEITPAYGVGSASNVEIDALGIANAVNLAMKRAIEALIDSFNLKPDYLIIDGRSVKALDQYESFRMDKGDLNHYSIAAASIIAKVARDTQMKKYALDFPVYGFERHMGYGTKFHLDALNTYGISPIHRKSFSPVSKFVVNL
ncbi:ribonuclease HII [Candidatus Dojkabacteria bacterium]|nr:ribonuclease HII [Candidatus Dojkabacteria bacterium]